jgi:hypothetical protein
MESWGLERANINDMTYACSVHIITVQLIQFSPLLQLLQSFFQNIA